MFKINTEKELYNFLKILSEESVKKSRKALKEDADPYNSYYLDKRKQEKNMFEQDLGDEPPESDTNAEMESEDDPAEAEAQPDQEDSKPAESEEKFVASKDRLVDFVNDIRSAPSIKDSAVSDQINDYYDRLSQEEKDVLVFFLRELSRVMTGKASGASARDPSDPPLSIKFVPEEEGDSQEQVADSETAEKTDPQGEERSELDAELASSAEAEEEDTSAPIKVNEAQDHSKLRARIRNLLL